MKMMRPAGSVSDDRVRCYVPPVRIVESRNCRGLEKLLRKGCGQATIWAEPGAFLKKNASLLLDFGRELHGGVRLISGRFPSGRPQKVRIRFGESVGEASSEPDNDHAMHDTVIELATMGGTEYGNTAFRFVRIDNREEDELELREICAVFLFRDLDYKGSFACDDPLLNRIFQTASYTLQLCMQDYLWDGAKRDRLIWMGDLHPEITAANVLFGETDVVKRSLNRMRDETVLPNFMNGISSYSVWYVIALRDFFLANGNREFLQSHRAYLLELLKLLESQIGEDGSEQLGGCRILDWGSRHDERSIHAGLHALLVWGFESGRELCALLEAPEQERRCRDAVERLKRYTPPECGGKSANALRVLAGLADAVTVNREKLAVHPFRGLSTFHGGYVLSARTRAGDLAGALDVLRKYWGGMLALGATTFWEHFDLAWMENASPITEFPAEGKIDVHGSYGESCFKGYRNSLCHGWSCGPVPFLAESVLGIHPEEPGCRRIRLAPRLGDLQFVRGTFPTPHGILHLEARKREDGRLHLQYSAPEGVKIVIAPEELRRMVLS